SPQNKTPTRHPPGKSSSAACSSQAAASASVAPNPACTAAEHSATAISLRCTTPSAYRRCPAKSASPSPPARRSRDRHTPPTSCYAPAERSPGCSAAHRRNSLPSTQLSRRSAPDIPPSDSLPSPADKPCQIQSPPRYQTAPPHTTCPI